MCDSMHKYKKYNFEILHLEAACVQFSANLQSLMVV